MKKLAIITSHPIQYNAPLFRLLTERKKIAVKVFYTWGQTKDGFVYDPDFKKEFKWDIPLLDGYDKEFVENVSPNPGAGHFKGIMNKDLVERIDQFQPDALLVFGWSFKSHLQLLRHYQGKKKIIFRGDSTLLDEPAGFSFKKTARRIFLKWVYSHIDYALYTGQDNRTYFLTLGLKPVQLHSAPHAVENERFYDPHGQYEQHAKKWKKEMGIPDSALVFLFAGKLEPKKDPNILIEALKEIKDENIRLLITGNGILEKELKKNAASDQRIIFLDFQNQQQMPIVYRLGDVFVLPSKGPGETWGLSVNEAMACAKPVIVSSKSGCAKDLVKANGIIFPATDTKKLAEAFMYFLNNKEQLKKQAGYSREQIVHFSLQNIAKRIEELV